MFTVNGARPHACLFFLLLVAHRCLWRYPGQQLALSAACHASHKKHNDASYVCPRLKVICKSIGSILPSHVYTPRSHSTCTQDSVRWASGHGTQLKVCRTEPLSSKTGAGRHLESSDSGHIAGARHKLASITHITKRIYYFFFIYSDDDDGEGTNEWCHNKPDNWYEAPHEKKSFFIGKIAKNTLPTVVRNFNVHTNMHPFFSWQ